ncbi:leucine-rich single-pass membrane protein 1 isoform X2 [Vulpes lagopus]|uniref:leucine-rich single-pass membrane protein 1 isoform X2 n=1 Tax=Vulpes lagopus TaxID=494514 RepID=UPI001BC967D6|nr:leucine-rich single-pass membrane protein 1 isoform X2 [Vulpes lagopus]
MAPPVAPLSLPHGSPMAPGMAPWMDPLMAPRWLPDGSLCKEPASPPGGAPGHPRPGTRRSGPAPDGAGDGADRQPGAGLLRDFSNSEPKAQRAYPSVFTVQIRAALRSKPSSVRLQSSPGLRCLRGKWYFRLALQQVSIKILPSCLGPSFIQHKFSDVRKKQLLSNSLSRAWKGKR